MRTLVYEVYTVNGRLYGNERAHLPPSQSVRGFEYTYHIRGKSANYIIVSNDPHLSLDAAVQFATAIATERLQRFTVSTEGLGTRRGRE